MIIFASVKTTILLSYYLADDTQPHTNKYYTAAVQVENRNTPNKLLIFGNSLRVVVVVVEDEF